MNEDNLIALAGCILTDDYGRVLLLHRNTEQFQHWELPGGKVEEDEDPATTAMREIWEELAVTVELVELLGDGVFSDHTGDYRFFWYSAQIVDGQLQVMETAIFDDYDYIELEDFPSLSLSANMLVLEEKLLNGEVVLN